MTDSLSFLHERDGKIAAAQAHEEESQSIGVGAPDNGVHVHRTPVGRPELKPRPAAHRQGGFEANLGPDRAQVHGFPMEGSAVGLDRDRPGDLRAPVAAEINSRLLDGANPLFA